MVYYMMVELLLQAAWVIIIIAGMSYFFRVTGLGKTKKIEVPVDGKTQRLIRDRNFDRR